MIKEKPKEEFPKRVFFDDRMMQITMLNLNQRYFLRMASHQLQQVGRCRGVKKIGNQIYFVNDRAFYQYFNLN